MNVLLQGVDAELWLPDERRKAWFGELAVVK
jgi:hypothetical protein